jgi:hypothetical protein
MLRTTALLLPLLPLLFVPACGDDLSAYDDTLEDPTDGLATEGIAADEFDDGSTDDDASPAEPPPAVGGYLPPPDSEDQEPPWRILDWSTTDQGELLIQASATSELEDIFESELHYGLWIDLEESTTYVAALDDQNTPLSVFAFAITHAPNVSGSYHQAAMWFPLDLPWDNCTFPPCPWELDPLGNPEGAAPDHMQMGVFPGGFETYGAAQDTPFSLTATYDVEGVIDGAVNTSTIAIEDEDRERIALASAVLEDLQAVFAELTFKVDEGQIQAADPCSVSDAAAWLSTASTVNDCCVESVGEHCAQCSGTTIPEFGLGDSC